MSRTLEQIDLALAAVETQLPRIQNGLTTTIQQTTLVIESEIGLCASPEKKSVRSSQIL